jgi:hypothetical protein
MVCYIIGLKSKYRGGAMYECDGCGKVGTEEELTPHILAQRLEEPTKCWGIMKIGGPAWEAFHGEGVHPMETIREKVFAELVEHDLKEMTQ